MKPLALVLALAIGDSGAAPVKAGDPAPTDGVFLTIQKAAQISSAHAQCLAEKDFLSRELVRAQSESFLVPVAVALVLGLAGGVIIGIQAAK